MSQYAEENGRQRVTAIHKANVMKLSDGLFLKCCREVADKHPSIKYDEMIIDSAVMALIKEPSAFDVMCMPANRVRQMAPPWLTWAERRKRSLKVPIQQ